MEENKENEKMWKTARWGIIIFVVFQIFLEMLMNNKDFALPVAANYFISSWIIQALINRGKKFKYIILIGFIVSFMVFLVRVAIGIVVNS